MKRIIHFFSAFTAVCVLFLSSCSHKNKGGSARDGMYENMSDRLRYLSKMLADPALGKIPDNMREKELAFSATLPEWRQFGKYAIWKNIGPHNVGGRTRAFAADRTDPGTFIAGAATGGLWKSTNWGGYWFPCIMKNAPTANITSVVQDKRLGKHLVWYASTGELYGGSLPGAFYNGSGVYKSTDGGYTWDKTGNLNTGLGGLSGAWSVVHRLAVNPAIDTADVVFAANFDGIFRSVNGGTSWVKVRGGSGTATSYSYFTDVAVTSSGIVYAALSGGGQQQGIWRSADNGKTWANITPDSFQSTTNRISIGISPSDEKQVYFIANTPGHGKESFNFEGTSEWNSLWKYSYLSGDGSGSGGSWNDRSANLPKLGGAFGDYISQGGYCLEVSVKPDNPDVVFIGGTNLYRSTDGFTTKDHTTWIGGYGVNTTLPDFKTYPAHHPDQHGVIFIPGESGKMVSVHDGGISYTENCMASQVLWQSLNNGFVTSQFYSIAQDPSTTGKLVVGGLQDNGSYLSVTADPVSNWQMPLSYDGAWCYVKPGGGELYLSIQQGRMHRMLIDAAGKPYKFTRIDPKGVDKSKYQFINPFTPDASDWKKLYTPAGNIIWHNSDISAIPFKDQLDSNASDLNWYPLPHTLLQDQFDEITAIVSPPLQSNVIYYGTQKGKLYRLRNASDTSSVPEAITGSNFPSAYINCIVPHPSDSSVLYAVFTNYSVLSIFESKDAGKSWNAISGNLEQNSTGSGNGPSCRWLTLARYQDSLIWFVGTSTGLYATKQINGMSTVWRKISADLIGNSIVTMMQYREADSRLVIATYGSGVFAGNVSSLDPSTGISEQARLDISVFPNPASESIQIRSDGRYSDFTYRLISSSGIQIKEGRVKVQQPLSVHELLPGMYYLVLESEGFKKSFPFIRRQD